MKQISINNFLDQYNLHDRGINSIKFDDESVTLTLDLFHCDDSERNNEDYEYLLKLEIGKKFVVFSTDNEDYINNFFMGTVLACSFKDNSIALCCTCETKERISFCLEILIGAEFLNVEETVYMIVF